MAKKLQKVTNKFTKKINGVQTTSNYFVIFKRGPAFLWFDILYKTCTCCDLWKWQIFVCRNINTILFNSMSQLFMKGLYEVLGNLLQTGESKPKVWNSSCEVFSPNWPTGLIWSSSHKVCPWLGTLSPSHTILLGEEMRLSLALRSHWFLMKLHYHKRNQPKNATFKVLCLTKKISTANFNFEGNSYLFI